MKGAFRSVSRRAFPLCLLIVLAIAIRSLAFAQVAAAPNSGELVLSSKSAISFGLLFTAAGLLTAAAGAWYAVNARVVKLEAKLDFLVETLRRHEDDIRQLREDLINGRQAQG